MRKFSEPIQFSQFNDEPMSQYLPQMMSVTPRNTYEEKKMSEAMNYQCMREPDSGITEQLRQSLAYNSLSGSDSRMTSQVVAPLNDDVQTWKEDFMMTSAFDGQRMSHVNPLQSTPYISQFKILDEHDQLYHLNAPQYEGIEHKNSNVLDHANSDTY